MTFNSDRAGTVVLGLGNPLMGDDGLGIAALRHLDEAWTFFPGVELVDGGTWGMNLLHIIESTQHLLLIDAINLGCAPGSLIRMERDELPRFFGIKMSPHQIDMREVLALAELRGTVPEHMVALGIQPRAVELSTELTPCVAAGFEELICLCLDQLQSWGHSTSRVSQRRAANA